MTTSTYAPLWRSCPPFRESFGDIAAKVGRDLGLDPDPEQRWLLDAIFAEQSPGLPAAPEVCVIAPRQNIKTSTLETAALTDLFVVGVPLAVWTAHEFKTARKSYEDMRRRIDAHPDYAARVSYRDSHGEEAIFLDTGERLEFHARSGGSGRGFTCHRLTLDEALFLRPGDVGAMAPTMVTIADAQIRYGSSAGKMGSEVLRGLRDRGRDGDPLLAYVEYGAEFRPCASPECLHQLDVEGCALDDRELWWQANSAMWAGRITETAMERQRRMLPPREFMREFFSWWEDPLVHAAGVFGEAWSGLADPDAERGSSVAFGVAVAPDRSWSAIAVAWKRPDGFVQVQVADYQRGADWLPERAKDLRAKWGGSVTCSTSAKGMVPGAVEPSQSEQAQAHNALDDLVSAGRVRHGDQPSLNIAVRSARWRAYGDTRMFDRKGNSDISPLDAAALAVHAVTTRPSSEGWVMAL